MIHHSRTILACCILVLCARAAQALPFAAFRDISAHSPSKRYQVKAQTPDNRPDSKNRSWQSDFAYTCTDTRTGKTLWTRKQQKKEFAPIALYVSDSGWTIIRIRPLLDELILVDRSGNDRGTIKLLRDGLSQEEKDAYVQYSPLPPVPHWDQYSLWQFLEADKRSLFVMRPWWGRRIVIDVDAA